MAILEALDECYSAVNPYDVERVARAICSSGHVFLYAHGDSELSCMAFANLLLKLGVHSSMGNLFYESSAVAHSVRKDDVVLVVSYRGTAVSWMENLVPVIKGRKAKLILVSAAPKPFDYDLSIRLPQKESLDATGKIATYYSQECVRYVLNCIYGEVYELTYAQSTSHKLAIDSANHS